MTVTNTRPRNSYPRRPSECSPPCVGILSYSAGLCGALPAAIYVLIRIAICLDPHLWDTYGYVAKVCGLIVSWRM